ncbi:MAG: hypothetical protein ACOCQD_00625 [archaeon]
MKYHTPSPSTPDDYCKRGTIANPDGREPAYDKCSMSLNERMAAMGLSYAQLYLLTGYRDFWGTVSVMLDSQQQYTNSQKDAYDRIPTKTHHDQPRFNYASRFGVLIPALMIDAASDPELQTSYAKYYKDDWAQQVEWVINALTENKQNVYWIPFENGSGTEPSRGTTISQGDVTAKYLMMNTHKWKRKKAGMLEKGYIQVSDISGGSFTAGHLSGIDAEATGSEEEDYRNGLVGTRSWTRSGLNPIFQFSAFTMNFLIDYYLYIKADSRIPSIVKNWCDIMLKNKMHVEEGDNGYKEGIDKWGEPYMLRDPIVHSGVNPWTLPIHSRVIAFTLKTHGVDETVNDKTYSEWYNICIDPKNLNGLIWQWRHFGQYYGWNQDAPWMMAQDSLIDYGPTDIRKPKQYNKIPGDNPDIKRNSKDGGIIMSYKIVSEPNGEAIKWKITLNDETHEGDVVDGKVEWPIPDDLPTGEHKGEARYGYPEYTMTSDEQKVLAGIVWSDPVEFTLKRKGKSGKAPILKIVQGE